MAAFTNLSDDLIYHLALPFQHDRSTLHALNLVSRALHRATLALLFRHTSQLTPAQNHLLHRTLSENPELKRYVHSCSVAIDHGKLDDAQLAWILALPNVRDLTVRRYDALQRTGNYWTDIRNASQLYRFGRSVECDFECGFLDKYEWKGVRSVCLQGGFTGTEIVRFVQLPDIRSLDATVLHIVNAPRVPDSPRPSTLTTLELRGGSLWRMEPSALRSILAFAPGLRVLRCQVPMDTMSNSIEEQTCSVVRPVSSAELCAALEPVRASLEELYLLNLRHCVPYDGTFLDLSGFSSLTHLEITSCCLLPVGAPRDRRGDLGKMLPASLARLKVRLDGRIYLLETPTSCAHCSSTSRANQASSTTTARAPLSSRKTQK
jgi:hypothetical protein